MQLSPSIMTAPARRVLVIGPAWVGDMVMAQSLYLTLKSLHPDCAIDVLAPSWSLPLLARMPQVSQAIELPVAHKQLALRQRWRVARKLRKHAYDQALVLPRSLKAALLPWLAGIPRRTGYRGEWRFGLINDMRRLDTSRLTQTVQRFVALGYPAEALQPPPIPSPQLRVDADNQRTLLTKFDLSIDPPVIAMMPGAEYGPAKQWPPTSYRALVEQVCKRNFQVWLLGSKKEYTVAEQIAEGMPAVRNLCGKTTLVEAVDLIALAKAAVSNDSGLMHVACATGVPVVAIYGSSSPFYTPPLSPAQHVIYHDLSCSPCFKRHCKYGHTACLNGIGVNEVSGALNAIVQHTNNTG